MVKSVEHERKARGYGLGGDTQGNGQEHWKRPYSWDYLGAARRIQSSIINETSASAFAEEGVGYRRARDNV